MIETISNTKVNQLQFSQYRSLIDLDVPFFTVKESLTSDEKEKVVDQLLSDLKEEMRSLIGHRQLETFQEKRQVLRAVINTLTSHRLEEKYQKLLDTLLQAELSEKKISSTNDIEKVGQVNNTEINLWKGDITCLQVDAIVNAANKQMLGCFQPLHQCIDNAIHSAAGVQLRNDCQTIMNLQGVAEVTGAAKITRGYNLPSKYVLHTVGPIVNDKLNDTHQDLLKNCYKNCLELANQIPDINSLAFCCISTGVFGYPQKDAAKVAIQTVLDWLNKNNHHLENIVFNVFSEKDYFIYQKILKNDESRNYK